MTVSPRRMKHFVALLASLSLAHAAPVTQNALHEGICKDLATLENIPDPSRSQVVAATARLLDRHLSFEPDGRIVSIYQTGEAQWEIEWRQLTIRHIAHLAAQPDDPANGIIARFRAHLTSQAHRRRSLADLQWSPWRPTDYVRFPAWIDIVITSTGPVAEAPATLLGFIPPTPTPPVASLRIPPSQPHR